MTRVGMAFLVAQVLLPPYDAPPGLAECLQVARWFAAEGAPGSPEYESCFTLSDLRVRPEDVLREVQGGSVLDVR